MEMETQIVGRVGVLILHGRFDAQHTDSVKQQILTLRKKCVNFVIDLEEVGFMDSAALATLVQGMKQARQNGGDLRIAGLQKPVRTIFELTRLDRAFSLFDTRSDAVKSFST